MEVADRVSAVRHADLSFSHHKEVTGLDRSTLQTYKSVANSVPSLLRNKDLSFNHHKEVAKLPEKRLKLENPLRAQRI